MSFPSELRDAYERAFYCVYTEHGELQLRVTHANQLLDKLLIEHGARSAAFITAANPGSTLLSDAVNAERNAQLLADVERAGFICLPGEGRDPAGEWQAEQSLLVIGISQADATILARRYGQHAWVFFSVAETARLVATIPRE
jgi:hypothetical protein